MPDSLQQDYITALKIARQYLDPKGTRIEVDAHIASGLPLSPALAKVVLAALAQHERNKTHAR